MGGKKWELNDTDDEGLEWGSGSVDLAGGSRGKVVGKRVGLELEGKKLVFGRGASEGVEGEISE